MSPAKSCDINGPRPSPLVIHKHSRLTRKPSRPPPQLRQPVIIYTHSPKVIHTQPKDFMALVQRLTGLTPPIANEETVKKPSFERRNLIDNDCSNSVLTNEENNDDDGDGDDDDDGPCQSNSLLLSSNVPLFTPNSSVFKYSSETTLFSSPGLVNSFSPSFMEFLKGLAEY